MGRVDDEEGSGIGKLAARYVGSKTSGIDRHGLRIGKYECVCGGLLNVELEVVELFHPGGERKGDGYEFCCPYCISVAHAMTGLRHDSRKCIRDIIGCKLTRCDVGGRRVRVVGVS